MLYYNNYLCIFCTAGSVSEDFSSARGGGHSKFIHLCCIIIITCVFFVQQDQLVRTFQVLVGAVTVSLFICVVL